MPRRSGLGQAEELRAQLVDLLTDFEERLKSSELREQVKNLIPAHYLLRDLGSSLLPTPPASARQRILAYLRRYVGEVIDGEELLVISGIGEYARRVREL